MRKIFTIFAAMLLAVAVKADPSVIAVSAGANTLSAAIGSSGTHDGDILELADGEFTESSSFSVKKSLTIRAAAGATPVIKQASGAYMSIKSNAKVLYKGLKFDGNNTATYGFYANDATNRAIEIRFEDCEFTGYKKHIITTTTKTHADSLIINNCYFHDNIGRSAVYFPASDTALFQTCKGVIITNSTFANNDATSDWTGIIDVRSRGNALVDSIGVIVDHCTFYKNATKNYDYADVKVYKSSKVTISNCIFFGSDSIKDRATHLYGGTIKNCLTINYGNETAGHRASDATFQDTILNRDPLFMDAVNADYALGLGSPAIGAGTDGSNIGDPRWGVARTVYCKMEHDWWTTGSAAIGAYAWGDGVAANAAWPGVRMARVSDDSENPEYKTWKIDLASRYTSVVFTRMNPSNEGDQYWGAKTNDLVIPAHLNLYTITSDEEKWDDDTHDHQKVAGSWSTKDAKFYIVGSMTDWEDAKKIGCTEDSYTLKGLAAGIHQFKIVDAENGAWLGMADLKNIASGGLFLYPDTYGNICFKLATAGDATITFKKNIELTVEGDLTVPAMSIVGSLVGGWNAENIKPMETALDMRTATYTVENLEIADGYEFKLIYDDMWITREGDNDTYYTIHSGWKYVDGLGMDSEGKKSIKLNASEAGNYIFTWDYATGTMNVSFPSDATAIDNTNAELKAVKRIENGQLIIEKAGKKYNAIGVEIK